MQTILPKKADTLQVVTLNLHVLLVKSKRERPSTSEPSANYEDRHHLKVNRHKSISAIRQEKCFLFGCS